MEADREFFCSCKLVPEVDLAVDVADQLGRGGDANPGQEDGGQMQTGQARRHVEVDSGRAHLRSLPQTRDRS